MAFVNDDQLEEPFLAGIELLGDRARLHLEVVLIGVLPPHRPQIRRTDHQCRHAKRFFVELRDRTGGNRLAQAHHVANHRATPLLEVSNGQLDGRLLEIKQLRVKRRGQMILGNALTRLATEVIHDLQIHLVRRWTIHRRPAFVQDRDQVLGDVDGEVVIPPLREPLGVLLVVVVVAKLGVQLTIAHHAAEGQVARTHDRHDRIGRILRTMRQIQLRMKRIAQMQLHAHLLVNQLLAERLQHLLVISRRNPQRQLLAELTRHLPSPGLDLVVVD